MAFIVLCIVLWNSKLLFFSNEDTGLHTHFFSNLRRLMVNFVDFV